MSITSFFTEEQAETSEKGSSIGQISISEFLNTAYRDFALYVLYSRAIPSMIDGFKPGQRKVVWVAGQLARTKKIKTAALSGATVLYAGFHHGDGSLSSAATLMAGQWCNNVPILDGEGNFGSRLVNEAGAPRYTFVKLSPQFDEYFIDNDVLEPSPDPEDKEPRFLLPLIPWVLVNGVSGIAIGYGTKIQPRDPKLLAKVCADFISGAKTEEQTLALDLPPHFEGFTGKVYKDLKGKWRCQGVFTREGRSTIRISDLPIGVERESYVTTLQGLLEKEKISDYSDNCSKQFDFAVKVPGAPQKSDAEIMKLLSLDHGIGETIRVIDDSGSLRTFAAANELLVAFCKYRLSIYPKRLKAWEKRDQERLDLLLSKVKFVHSVLDLELVLAEFRDSKASLKAELVRRLYPQAHLEDLLDMRVWHFSDSWLADTQKEIIALQKAVETWKNAVPAKMYEKELRSL
jgi:DNA gyrase/topoisomerase IV subunit A